MKIRNLWCAIVFGILFFQNGFSQITNLDYQIRFNPANCRWDCYIVINGGSATSPSQRTQSNAQYSVVVPTGSTVSVAQNFNPIQNNLNYTGTLPTVWSEGSRIVSPAVEPQSDFYGFTPSLNPTSWFNNIAAGDTIRLFSLNITPTPNCASGVRIFRNGIDPPSSAPGMGGGDFSNGYTLGGIAQRYRANLPKVNPPAPVLNATTTCSRGVEIDLSVTTTSCLNPMTYSWSGPNGFTATTQDVNINPATMANTGPYSVTVTNARGCSATTTIEAVSKPNAGNNFTGCASQQYNLQGSEPNTGTWTSLGTNPAGATLSPGANGAASVSFDGTAVGNYSFIYDTGACKDTVVATINQADAGDDPASVNCNVTGTASLGASGTGFWSLGAGSAGTANFSNALDPNTTVSGFSVPGIYYFVWTSQSCTDMVQLTVDDECSCAITNNVLNSVNPSTYCGLSSNITITGSNPTPAGGEYLWIYSLNNGLYSSASGTNNQQNYTTGILGQGAHRFRRVYSLPSAPGCLDTSNVVLITVNDTPATPTNLVANPNPSCIGQTINLSVTNISGITYTWTASSANAGLNNSTSSTNTMLPVSSGNYGVSVTASSNGCTSSPASINVLVYDTPPTPNINSVTFTNPTVCNGSDGTISFSGLTPNTSFIINYTRNSTNQSANVTTSGTGVGIITGLSAGTYANFTVVTFNGCPSGNYAGPVNLVDPNAPAAPANLAASPNPTCQNVTISLSVTNNPGATYTWSSSSAGAGLNSSTTNTNTMLPTTSGFFNIMVTQTVAGCTSPAANLGISVNASPPTPTAGNVTSTNPTTCGGANGTITLAGYLTNTSYTVEYVFNSNPVTTTITSNGSGNIVISGRSAGSYSNFRITNVSGCSSAVFPGPVVLTDPSAPAAPSNLTANPNPVCMGLTAALSVTNNPGATYTWTASSANAGLTASANSNTSMAPLSTGTYTISVTQTVAGCTSLPASLSVGVNPGAPVLTGVTGTNPSTCSGSDGIITISGAANNTTYTVNYTKNGSPVSTSLTSNASGQIVISGQTSGVYASFNVTNSSNCTSNTLAGPVLLTDPNAPSAPANLTANPNPVCAGTTVNLSVTNNPGATYTWTASNANAGLVASTSNTTTMTSTVAATYTILVSQTVGGCTSPSASVQVVVNPLPATPVAGQFTSTNPSTCGGTNGSISISGLIPNTQYSLQYSRNNVTQNISLTANGTGIITIPNLTAGTYNNFRLTNSNNCQSGVSTHSISLSDPGAPAIPQNLTAIPNPVCLGASVNLSVTNNPGATYVWTASSSNAGLLTSSTNTTSMLATVAGSYTINVIQTVAGCTSDPAQVIVVVNNNPPALNSTNVTGVNPTSCGGSNGQINISGLANNTIYTLQYSVGANTLNVTVTSNSSGIASVTGLLAGSYSNFRLTNASSCSSNTFPGPIVLSDPSAPSIPGLTASPNPACLGTTVNFTATGASGATFSWSAGSLQAGLGSSNTATNWMMPTSAGTFVISVTQSLGSCSSPAATVSVLINPVPPTPTAGNVTSTNPTVCAGTNGTISLAGYPANQTYNITYSRNNVEVTVSGTSNGVGVITISNLTAGTYSNFSVTSAAGCASGIFAGPISLNDPNSPPAPSNLNAVPNPVCIGNQVNLSVTNTSGATYTWTVSPAGAGLGTSTSNTNTMNPTLVGSYTVQVSQTIAGCTSPNASVVVVVNPVPATPDANTVSKVDPTCDNANGSLLISGLVANADYTVQYSYNNSPRSVNATSNNSGVITITNLAGGQYTNFRLTNAFGCNSGLYAGPVNLINPGLPSAPSGIRFSPNFICIKNNVELNVDPIQGATYNWYTSSPLAGLSQSTGASTSMVPAAAGLYAISVTQTINGCTSPPASILVEVRGDCFNPDFDVTYVDIQVTGNVSTNDGASGASYTSIQPVAGNPSPCIPSLQNDGTYIFVCSVAGVYQFEVNSCTSSCDVVPLVITVLAQNVNNKPPVVNHDYARTKMNIPVEIEILVNDRCQNSLSCALNNPTIATPPTRGSYNVLTKMYTPNSNFIGIDSFRYEVCQTPVASPVNCQRAWVYVTVVSLQAPNITNGMDDYAQTAYNTALSRSAASGLLANDTDPEGDGQSVVAFTSNISGVGNLVVNSDGSYTFTPATGFYGPYFWPYRVCDNLGACDNATLHILVEHENLASKVGNFIWLDNNANGIQDIGESGMANCQVRLYNDSGVMVASTTTTANGAYEFENIVAGNYFMRVMTPANYVYSPAHVGNPLTDSDITGTMGAGTTGFFQVVPGEDRMDIDAGMYICSRVSGYLWYDYLMNDRKDNFENGMNGLFVELWRNVNGTFEKVAQTTTGRQPGTASEDGYFNFPCVPPGEYYLRVDLPLIGLVRVRPNIGNDPTRDSDLTNANGPMTTNTFNLTPGQHKSDLAGGFYPMASAGNRVWIDENHNGIQEDGEPPVSGVVVEARDANTHAIKGVSTTDETGEYNIEYLEKSDVYLKFRLPSTHTDFTRTYARIGDDAMNSDVDNSFGPWTTRAVAMEPNLLNPHIDLGIVAGLLPVTWVNVNASKDQKGQHVIQWETANEVNLSHYIVERSMHNTDNFVTVGDKILPLEGQNINKIYSALDRDNQNFGVYYYRIKQVDLDGKFTYSSTVSLRNEYDYNVSVYPSPATQSTIVSVSLPKEGNISIDLFDLNGKHIAKLRESSEFDKGNHPIELNLSNINSGVYSLSIVIENQVITKKLVILSK